MRYSVIIGYDWFHVIIISSISINYHVHRTQSVHIKAPVTLKRNVNRISRNEKFSKFEQERNVCINEI